MKGGIEGEGRGENSSIFFPSPSLPFLPVFHRRTQNNQSFEHPNLPTSFQKSNNWIWQSQGLRWRKSARGGKRGEKMMGKVGRNRKVRNAKRESLRWISSEFNQSSACYMPTSPFSSSPPFLSPSPLPPFRSQTSLSSPFFPKSHQPRSHDPPPRFENNRSRNLRERGWVERDVSFRWDFLAMGGWIWGCSRRGGGRGKREGQEKHGMGSRLLSLPSPSLSLTHTHSLYLCPPLQPSNKKENAPACVLFRHGFSPQSKHQKKSKLKSQRQLLSSSSLSLLCKFRGGFFCLIFSPVSPLFNLNPRLPKAYSSLLPS